MNYLVVVDMQNDFISGSLGTKEAQSIVKDAVKYVLSFNGKVIFTQDTHDSNYPSTQEGRKLPVEHCQKGSDGWKIYKGFDLSKADEVFEKNTFASVSLAEYFKNKKDVSSIEFIGVCTDICVVSNALTVKAFLPEIPISVISHLCAGTNVKNHEAALETMKSCQIEIK